MRRWGLAIAYMGFALGGVALFAFPSPSLSEHGGVVLVFICAVLCVLAAVLGIVGMVFDWPVCELVGCSLGASTSLAFATALIIQAVVSRSPAPLTALAFTLVVVGLVGQRWMDSMDRKE